jgi:hypothetical protein
LRADTTDHDGLAMMMMMPDQEIRPGRSSRFTDRRTRDADAPSWLCRRQAARYPARTAAAEATLCQVQACGEAASEIFMKKHARKHSLDGSEAQKKPTHLGLSATLPAGRCGRAKRQEGVREGKEVKATAEIKKKRTNTKTAKSQISAGASPCRQVVNACAGRLTRAWLAKPHHCPGHDE